MSIYANGAEYFPYAHGWLTADDIENFQNMESVKKEDTFQATEWALFFATHAKEIAGTVKRQVDAIDEETDKRNAEDLMAVTPDLAGISVPVWIHRH